MSVFAVRLKELRGTRNQADFARMLGVKTAAYGHYETGRTQPSIDVIVRIITITGVSADWLLGTTEEKGIKNLRAETAEGKLLAVKKSLIALIKEL